MEYYASDDVLRGLVSRRWDNYFNLMTIFICDFICRYHTCYMCYVYIYTICQYMFCKDWSAADKIMTPTSWQYQMFNLWFYTWCMNILHVNMFQYMFCKGWSAAEEIITPTSWPDSPPNPSFTTTTGARC